DRLSLKRIRVTECICSGTGKEWIPPGWIAFIHVLFAGRNVTDIAQPLHLPLAVEAGEAFLAGEQLLHGGLFEVALLGDDLIERARSKRPENNQPSSGSRISALRSIDPTRLNTMSPTSSE